MTLEAENHPPLGPDDLIAYLDGEVDVETHHQIERRLAEDPQLVQRMREHQQAWDLLDELPRGDVSEDFAQTTLEMVAVAATNDAAAEARAAHTRRNWFWGAAGLSLIAASLGGFWITAWELGRPHRELLQDLPVIENLDALQQVENIDFLYALENEGLFVAEVNNEP